MKPRKVLRSKVNRAILRDFRSDKIIKYRHPVFSGEGFMGNLAPRRGKIFRHLTFAEGTTLIHFFPLHPGGRGFG